MQTRVLFNVRGTYQPNFAEGTDEQPQINCRGETLVSQGLPPLTTISKFGNSYVAISAAVAPVVAIPTTAALISLYNGEPEAGKAYVIDALFVNTIVLTAATQPTTIIANWTRLPVPTAAIPATSVTPRNLRCGQGYRGQGIVAAAGTNAISADGWYPFGSTGGVGAASTFGQSTEVDVKGVIIIPPRHMLNLSGISTAATASSIQIGIRWHELIIPIVQ